MSDKHNRRAFLRKSVAAALGGAAGAAVVADTARAQPAPINPNAKAVLPNGKAIARGEILRQLGLNPNTPPDAWLAVIGCGSNASALLPNTRENLMRRGLRIEGNELAAPAGGAVRPR